MSNDGGAAFPTFEMVTEYHEGKQQYVTSPYALSGMSLRDYFAAQALNGWIASYAGSACQVQTDSAAKLAYELADAMLAARLVQEHKA